MSFSNTHSLSERLDEAAKARSMMLVRFRARPAADDPAVLERQSARRAVIEAREIRGTERAAIRRAEVERVEVERMAAAACELAELGAQAERAEVRKAELKTQRDARYLARKAKVRRCL